VTGDLHFWMRRILLVLLAKMAASSEFTHFSHRLLLRHFALVHVTPNTQAISVVAIKCIAQVCVDFVGAVVSWGVVWRCFVCVSSVVWVVCLDVLFR